LHAYIGKTPPRLIEDLKDYDPRYRAQNGKNLLADSAPQYRRGIALMRRGRNDCQHALMRKAEQTKAPASADEKPDGKVYVVASYCSKCRYHFDITVDFRAQNDGQVPCRHTDYENPMHHLQLIETRGQLSGRATSKSHLRVPYEQYRFICSGTHCPAKVEITITPPRLPDSILGLFNKEKILEARGKRIIADDPVRYEGMVPLKPFQALTNIRAYLVDAKRQSAQPETTELKKIAKRNKKYVLGFADECDALFTHLGFTSTEAKGDSVSVALS